MTLILGCAGQSGRLRMLDVSHGGIREMIEHLDAICSVSTMIQRVGSTADYNRTAPIVFQPDTLMAHAWSVRADAIRW